MATSETEVFLGCNSTACFAKQIVHGTQTAAVPASMKYRISQDVIL